MPLRVKQAVTFYIAFKDPIPRACSTLEYKFFLFEMSLTLYTIFLAVTDTTSEHVIFPFKFVALFSRDATVDTLKT